MELLILLATKDGHLVTRQEIVEQLWGKDVFVDTEHGINTAVRKIRLALRDDPEKPRFVQTVTGKGYCARDYDRAIREAQKAMQLDSDYHRTHFWLGRVYAQKRMYKEAIADAEIVLKATPDSHLGLTEMAYSLALGGREPEARTSLKKLELRRKNGFVPAYNLAVIHVALNENVAALDLLQEAYEEHDWALLVLAVEPRLDPVRNDPEFHQLAMKLSLLV